MFRMMLKDMLVTAKRKFQVCVFYAVIIFGGMQMAGNYMKGFGVDGSTFFGGNLSAANRCLFSVLLLVLIYMIVQELPLRICRGMFLCAAGEKERMRYLVGQLSVKMFFSFLLLTAALLIATKGFFVSKEPLMCVIQLVLYFFTLFNINLKIGIGIKGARKVDERGFALYSPAEVAVNTNWFCFLLIQNVLFYSAVLMDYKPDNRTAAGFLLCVLLLNSYYAVRYPGPVLREAMLYENVYRQEPVREYAQKDILGAPTYTIFRI